MKRKQWFVLAWGFLLLGMFFIYLDRNNGFNPMLIPGNLGNPCDLLERMTFEKYDNGEITLEEYGEKIGELTENKPFICIFGGEMYEPFIYLSYFLWIVFMICGFLEPKSKH